MLVPTDISHYSDDLDTDDLASFLNNWEDPSSDTGLKLPTRPDASEKLTPTLDSPVSTPSEPYVEPPPPAMDIENDFTVGENRNDLFIGLFFWVNFCSVFEPFNAASSSETLERMARLRDHCNRTPSPPPVQPRRRQAPRKAREKRVAAQVQGGGAEGSEGGAVGVSDQLSVLSGQEVSESE